MESYHSIVIGRGKPLIFLPAAGFSGMEGLNIAEALSDEYESHLLDLPGMGKSNGISGNVSKTKIASWVKNYVDQHNLKKVTFVGHSMGAGVAMCFATVYPDDVAEIILLDQGHFKIPRFQTAEFGLLGYAVPILSIAERILGDMFAKKVSGLFSSKESAEPSEADNEKRLGEFCERFQLPKSEYITKALKEDIDFTHEGLRLMFGYYRLDLPKMLKQLTVPCLLIYASFHDIDPKRERFIEKSVQKIAPSPNLQIKKIDSHHYVHWADDKCISEVKSFVDSHDEVTTSIIRRIT
ncbi:alpha/beta hydrolase [Virgibacillus kekensis]|uniref:Alpha/beta hydrolase n=1 Tax=Virgibacillus kekensis TaxID=202261 RepID=A0ABV9DKD3_9BACI